MARSALAELDIAAGRLVRPVKESVPADFAYWIVCPKVAAKTTKITAFTSWLGREAQRTISRETLE